MYQSHQFASTRPVVAVPGMIIITHMNGFVSMDLRHAGDQARFFKDCSNAVYKLLQWFRCSIYRFHV